MTYQEKLQLAREQEKEDRKMVNAARKIRDICKKRECGECPMFLYDKTYEETHCFWATYEHEYLPRNWRIPSWL